MGNAARLHPEWSWDIIIIDAQTITTQQALDLYWNTLEEVPGLLVQWMVTGALPEVYVGLIKKRKNKWLSTFIISSWYDGRWVKLWIYDSILRNIDVGGVYLEWVNLNDIEEVGYTLSLLIWEWKKWEALEKAMLEKFWKQSGGSGAVNDALVEIL